MEATFQMCGQYSGLRTDFVVPQLQMFGPCPLTQPGRMGCWESFRWKVGSCICRALKMRFDQLQWADAKLGPIKTESLESPMKSAATSSPNAAPHYRDVKIWGHDFNCVPNLWLELKCEIACVSTRNQSDSTFFVMLRSACFCRYIVQNTHGGVTSWRLQVGFHRNVLLQVSFIPQCSTLRIHAEGPSGQTSLSLSLPLTGLMSYDSYVIWVFDPFNLQLMHIHRIAAMNGIHPAQPQRLSIISCNKGNASGGIKFVGIMATFPWTKLAKLRVTDFVVNHLESQCWLFSYVESSK